MGLNESLPVFSTLNPNFRSFCEVVKARTPVDSAASRFGLEVAICKIGSFG